VFIRLAKIVSWLALILGSLRVATVLFVLLTDDPQVATRMLLGSHNTGYYMDQGIYAVVFAIVLGVLVGIATDVQKIANANLARNSKEIQ